MLHGRGHAGKILHRTQADVEVQHLPQRDIQRADAAAHRRRQRTFDADQKFLERLDRVVGQPVVELVLGGFASKNLEPRHLALAAVGLFHRRVKNQLARVPDVRTRAIAANERQDGVVRDRELSAADRDFPANRRSDVFVSHEMSFCYRTVASNSRAGKLVVTGISARCAFTCATTFATVKPCFSRKYSTVVACSMNLSGQPMRATGVCTCFSLYNSSTLLP